MRVGEMTYRTIIAQRRVIPSGKTMDDEGVTIIGMADEGGGAFVTVRQEEQLNANEIRIDPDEWPAVRAAVNRMVRECGRAGE